MPGTSPAPLSAYSSSIAFLDESGAISHDRFFAVGCLKLAQPCDLTRVSSGTATSGPGWL